MAQDRPDTRKRNLQVERDRRTVDRIDIAESAGPCTVTHSTIS